MVRVLSVLIREIAPIIPPINIREGGRLRPRDVTSDCIQLPYYFSRQTRKINRIQYREMHKCVLQYPQFSIIF